MDLYTALAAHYDDVFPVTPAKLGFARSVVGDPPQRILDIGCATGSLAIALAQEGHRVTAVDLGAEMIELARRRPGGGEVEFQAMDMRDVASSLPAGTFDTVLCLGNTLPHLSDEADIARAVQGARTVLRPEGKAVFQIVNFSRFTGAQLPSIKNDRVRFTRRYEPDPASSRVKFITSLLIRADGQVYDEETLLYPLNPEELISTLRGAGFGDPSLVAGYDGAPYTHASAGVICMAQSRG